MCGIAGFFSLAPISDGVKILERMGTLLERRGPDAQGIWLSDNDAIGLVHRRLAIVDLSAGGRQPMLSSCGRFAITFNGEIYNHVELKKRLLASFGDESESIDWKN